MTVSHLSNVAERRNPGQEREPPATLRFVTAKPVLLELLLITALVVLRHFMVEKTPQSRSRQENYVDALKMARTLVNSGFIPS